MSEGWMLWGMMVFGACCGAFLSGIGACIPSLHIYSVLGLLTTGMVSTLCGIPLLEVAAQSFFISMVVGWAILNAIPSIFLAAPDESALFTVLPGQMMLQTGRGMEAMVLTVLGGVGGVLFIMAVAPFAAHILPPFHSLLRPHFSWMVWAIIAFMMMSEWPQQGTRGQGGWRKWSEGMLPLGAGWATFILSGFLGFILMYRSPLPLENTSQQLMPAFVGLFAVPALLVNTLSRVAIPAQRRFRPLAIKPRSFFAGVMTGCMGGALAAFLPAVTGGVGSLLAGHATAQRDEKIFLIAQGACKAVYYIGGVLLFFVPGLVLSRGGATWLYRSLGFPADGSSADYLLVLGSIILATALALLMAVPLSRSVLRLMRRFHYRTISWMALVLMVILVLLQQGLMGLIVMAAGSGIGLLPILYGSRRMNALGIVLLPIACNMCGWGLPVAEWLGLVAP